MPAHRCDAGELGEDGVRSMSATSSLVMTAGGASGEGGKGLLAHGDEFSGI